MKKFLFAAACLLVSSATGFAECPHATLFSPVTVVTAVTTVPPQNFTPEQNPALDLGDLNILESAVKRGPENCDCFTICEQTPNGCACEGFVCDGIFYCAIPVC